jgi:uncharacterized protein
MLFELDVPVCVGTDGGASNDGQNMFDDKTSYVGEWQADETLERLARDGNELIAVAGGDEEWREETVGRVQVVGVRSRTATIRIMTVTAPTAVRPGLRLVLDRKMP